VSGMEDRQRQLVAQPMRLALNGGSLRVVTEQASLDSVALLLLSVLLRTGPTASNHCRHVHQLCCARCRRQAGSKSSKLRRARAGATFPYISVR